MNTNIKNTKGFTIIEVVLVLAIAALIFLMVFIALPALQASQRDTARKNDAGTVVAAVQSYMSTERKSLTASDDAALRKYIDKLDQYDAANVSVESAATGDASVAQDQVKVYVATKCEGTQLKTGVARSAAVVVKLESGTGTNYCVDV